MLQAFGTIQSCTVLHDHHGYSKLVGFVQFSSDEEAKKAVQEMHNKVCSLSGCMQSKAGGNIAISNNT